VAHILGFDLTGVHPATGIAEGVACPAATGASRLRRLAMAVKTVAPGLEDLRRWARDRHFARLLRPYRDHIYHEPNFMLRPFAGPSVVTIHDLSVLHYPQFHPRERVRYFERELHHSLARADHIITDAPQIRDEVIQQLGVAGTRVTSVPLGIDAGYRPLTASQRQNVLHAHGLTDKSYLFCAATLEPRKNLAGLVNAYERLPTALRQRHPLVMAGASGWGEERFAARLATLERRGALRRLGYVAEADLPALYGGARAFAFPSFYEGFGLPPLEAMACAIPVLTSAGTTMAALLNGAALLTDPHDEEAITRGLERLLTDDTLAERALIEGPALAKHYSWRRCADRMVEIYRMLSPPVPLGP
jgi:alpha-1,3-rhamnosyl/mannosyltransferase